MFNILTDGRHLKSSQSTFPASAMLGQRVVCPLNSLSLTVVPEGSIHNGNLTAGGILSNLFSFQCGNPSAKWQGRSVSSMSPWREAHHVTVRTHCISRHFQYHEPITPAGEDTNHQRQCSLWSLVGSEEPDFGLLCWLLLPTLLHSVWRVPTLVSPRPATGPMCHLMAC